jgi:predicted TIM-barrel fold metal-dependent hydrolase
MYGSAYPHWSTSAPDAAVAGLSNDKREKLLWRNASDLYGIGAKEDSLT